MKRKDSDEPEGTGGILVPGFLAFCSEEAREELVKAVECRLKHVERPACLAGVMNPGAA